MWTIYKKQRKNKKIKETGDSRYIYQNGLDKACFLQDMAYEDFKDLTSRTASNKMLCDKAINITQNPKYDGCQRGLASMVYNFFDKKSTSLADKSASGGTIKNENISNEELSEELQKPIIRKLKKRKVHSTFIDHICVADLADARKPNN